MSTLVVEYLNRRYTVKTTPTMAIVDVLSSVCSRLKPPLDSANCSLVRGNCTLDPSLSVRLANLPSGTKLKLVSDAPASVAGSSQVRTNADGADGRQAGPSSTSECAAAARQQRCALPSESADHRSFPTSGGQTSAGESSSVLSGERGVFLFHRDALSGGGQDPQAEESDDFYDVTREDLMMMVASYDAARRKLERGLMTSAMREAEQRKAAAELGPLRIRFQFLDGFVLQSSFAATELVEALYELLGEHVLEAFRAKLELTAFPKQALKDRKMSLVQANLAPAANVSVGIDGKWVGGEVVLRPEVLQQKSVPPNWQGQQDAPQGAISEPAERAWQQPSRDGGVAGNTVQPRKGIPKWMKLGK
ncbi:unnamed protein product [Ostreobium quekettii]|uniref:TUG ubiquitin-like domain-containing protein n=1 Tax=Ostreobium quekettii TaxID=121088 RepID=A0A8S1IP29_9CHLO|nr:unnamed protein product [Ostreobium quekettii]|eukprot:evm.model.scf_98.10 EVM.evm.TU.scf_98.10   scf_98:84247-85335(+)